MRQVEEPFSYACSIALRSCSGRLSLILVVFSFINDLLVEQTFYLTDN